MGGLSLEKKRTNIRAQVVLQSEAVMEEEAPGNKVDENSNTPAIHYQL